MSVSNLLVDNEINLFAKSITADEIIATDFTATNGNFDSLTAEIATISECNVSSELAANDAVIDTAQIGAADISALTGNSAVMDHFNIETLYGITESYGASKDYSLGNNQHKMKYTIESFPSISGNSDITISFVDGPVTNFMPIVFMMEPANSSGVDNGDGTLTCSLLSIDFSVGSFVLRIRNQTSGNWAGGEMKFMITFI